MLGLTAADPREPHRSHAPRATTSGSECAGCSDRVSACREQLRVARREMEKVRQWLETRGVRRPCHLMRTTIACRETTTEIGPPIGERAGGVSSACARRVKGMVGVDAMASPGPECAPRGMP